MSEIWQNAGTADDDFAVQSATCTPYPVVKDTTVTFTLTGTLQRAITGGTADLKVKYGIITVAKESTALTAAAAGPYTASATLALAAESPSGAYLAQVSVVDQNGKQIAAVNVEFRVS
ncbi:ML domain-containing protein [Kitasatospora purpeofusca]|uniref:ML domain-containing protein n=1 Tax=Kitasatospora purpeofusca TaxID=67352 RepID=UPI0035DB1BE4